MTQLSHYKTVSEVLALIKHHSLTEGDINPCSVKARKAIPRSRPYARIFMAWELFYNSPNALRDTQKAMDRQ